MIKKILLMPFNLIKKLFKKIVNFIFKIFNRPKRSRIEELKAYLELAKMQRLKVDAQVNYNNELIINMSNFEKESKRVRKKEQ